jgi:exonuclease III
LRIATWNVNSIRQRLPHLLSYLKEVQPDVLCLQEIKCLDEQFPRMEIEELGYNILEYEEPLVLAGDFNVIPEPRDATRPEDWVNDALFLPATRFKFRELLALGLIDALRATTDASGLYTFWDYQAGAWQKNNGIRIDHLLLSPQAADKLQSVTIDKEMRGRDKASDHTPVRVELAA